MTVSAADETTTPATDGRGPSPRRRRLWRRLLRTRSSPPPSTETLRRFRLEQLLAVLEAARAELDAGWAQGGWWSVQAGGGRPVLVSGLAAGAVRPETVSAVCLVGALVRAASRQDPQDCEVGAAVDAVYDALWESRGQADASPGPDLLRASAPQVRLARVQTLTRWNDEAGRTREDVLAILDRAIARAILSLCGSPAPAAAGNGLNAARARSR